MGAGIAYVAAASGMDTRIYDADAPALQAGLGRVLRDIDSGAERGKLDEDTATRA